MPKIVSDLTLKTIRGCASNKNNDEKCFLRSILSLFYSEQCRNYLDRVSKYQKYEHELNLSEFQYLADTKDFDKFEYQNNISVNVYGYKD